MKKSLLFCTLAVALMALAGCRKENPIPSGVSTGTDDVQFLLANLVFTDGDDITGYMTGYGLSQADPGEISIPCESLEKAQEMFKSWIPDKADTFQNGETIIWNMTDTLGVSQGQAALVAGGDKGAVAHVELPNSFPLVSGINFLPATSFPQNGEKQMIEDLDEFYFLNKVMYYAGKYDNVSHGQGVFVVIREYDEDTNTSGIIMFCHEKEYNQWFLSDSDYKTTRERARKVSELKVVAKAYQAYYSEIDKVLASIPNSDDGNDNYLCIVDGSKPVKSKRFNLRTGEESDITLFKPTYQECFVYFFTVEDKKDGNGYELVFK